MIGEGHGPVAHPLDPPLWPTLYLSRYPSPAGEAVNVNGTTTDPQRSTQGAVTVRGEDTGFRVMEWKLRVEAGEDSCSSYPEWGLKGIAPKRIVENLMLKSVHLPCELCTVLCNVAVIVCLSVCLSVTSRN